MIQLDTNFDLTDKKGIHVSVKMKIALSLVSESTSTPQDSAHLAIGGLPDTVVNPETRAQPANVVGGVPFVASQAGTYLKIGGLPVDRETRVEPAKAVGGLAYEGLKAVVDGLYECSDMFLPLKTAAGVFRTVTKFVEVCDLMPITDSIGNPCPLVYVGE
jgi:hypothetical protein